MSESNVEFVRALFSAPAGNKEAILAALPEAIPAAFHPDAEWIEAPERPDRRTWRGHDGIRESFERWLEEFDRYDIRGEAFEDHGDQVLVIARETGRGAASGAATDSLLYAVFTLRDGKIARYEEFYGEAAARAALAVAASPTEL